MLSLLPTTICAAALRRTDNFFFLVAQPLDPRQPFKATYAATKPADETRDVEVRFPFSALPSRQAFVRLGRILSGLHLAPLFSVTIPPGKPEVPCALVKSSSSILLRRPAANAHINEFGQLAAASQGSVRLYSAAKVVQMLYT